MKKTYCLTSPEFCLTMNIRKKAAYVRNLLIFLRKKSKFMNDLLSYKDTIIFGSALMYNHVETFLKSGSDIDMCVKSSHYDISSIGNNRTKKTILMNRKYITHLDSKVTDTQLDEFIEKITYNKHTYNVKIQVLYTKNSPFNHIRYTLQSWYVCNMLMCTMGVFSKGVNFLYSRSDAVNINQIINDYNNKHLRFSPKLHKLIEYNGVITLLNRTTKMIATKGFRFIGINNNIIRTLKKYNNKFERILDSDCNKYILFEKELIRFFLIRIFGRDVATIIYDYDGITQKHLYSRLSEIKSYS